MTEYIEREAIMEFPIRKDRCDKEHANEHFIFGVESVLEYVENLPAADVVPVVHGQWEWFEEWYPSTPDHPMECEDYGWRCGECKTALEDMVGGCWDDSYDEPKLNYCPNCGAKMDGGDSDEVD